MKKQFDFLKMNEKGIYLPYTLLMINILLVFFLIHVDIFNSLNSFYQFTKTQNKLERVYSIALYELKQGEISLQSNSIKYYNNTKIIWDFHAITNDEYRVTLTCSNSKIKNHVVQFKYKKSTNEVTDWTD